MPARVFFTSDLHFGHKFVISAAKRPFSCVEEMDAMLVENWNEVVEPQDTVYFLGDLSYHNSTRTQELLKSLRGHIHLIRGNHDKRLKAGTLAMFESVSDMKTVKIPDPEAPDGVRRIVLCHYAMRVWDRSHFGAWHLFGHSHGSLADDPHALSLDVGTDVWSYHPASYEEVKARMATKQHWKPVDHHVPRASVSVPLDFGSCRVCLFGPSPCMGSNGGQVAGCSKFRAR